ncbi:hypothetical protein CYY_002878 [Polysphondylium violaceum]|uniref:EF-hand domain-containing protein n=1 Tax=Polysphondylium violaceum TaxID=133409 RepID=A0A8J4V0J7_9MYCE|nr:hypothetical protein CYY_002878 [Polysphondylium violaceum]
MGNAQSIGGFTPEERKDLIAKTSFSKNDINKLQEDFKREYYGDQEGLKLDCKEFIGALHLFTRAPIEEKLGCLFDVFDSDGSGFLEGNETFRLYAVLISSAQAAGKYQVDEAQKIIKNVFDTKPRVSRSEFILTLSQNQRFTTILGFYPNYSKTNLY